METHVEGEWQDFYFKRATEADCDKIQELIKESYFKDEPLTIRFGYSQDYDEDFQHIWKAHLSDGLSFCAFEKGTDKIAAVRISLISKKDDPEMEATSEACKKILKFVEIMDKDSDVFNKYGVDQCAFLLLTTVHQDFRGRGLVTEIYRRSINLCRALGYKVIKCCFSSPYSRKAAANVGFKQVSAIEYGKMKDENGQPFVPNSLPDDLITQAVYIIE